MTMQQSGRKLMLVPMPSPQPRRSKRATCPGCDATPDEEHKPTCDLMQTAVFPSGHAVTAHLDRISCRCGTIDGFHLPNCEHVNVENWDGLHPTKIRF